LIDDDDDGVLCFSDEELNNLDLGIRPLERDEILVIVMKKLAEAPKTKIKTDSYGNVILQEV